MNAKLKFIILFYHQNSAFIVLNETISNIFEVGKAEEGKSNLNYYDMLVIESIKSSCP
jgi:hypothetical protein